MMHKAIAKFWKRYDLLPKETQQLADKNFDLLLDNPFHPSLHFKEIKHRPGLWSARVGEAYRAVAILEEDTFYWFWIGSHAEYDRLIS